jgi:predicted ATP-grasp superfamily ATP-dependent carboligase
VIVKPVAGYRFSGRFGGKLLAASDRAGLCDAVTRVAGSGNRCYIHDLVPGADDQIYCHCVYLNPDGTIRAELTVRKLRQSPPFFGVARVAELAGKKDYLSDATVAFLRRIRYHGMAVAEFKLDPRDGSYRFLEVNARSVIYNALLSQAGMDLAGLAWSGRIEGRHEKADIRPWPGVWVNLHADLLYSTLRGRAENLTLKGFISPYLRPKIDAVWSTRDPMPFIRQWSWTMERGIKGLFGL